MTDVSTTADIVKFRKAMTNAERQKAWRQRQKAAKATGQKLAKLSNLSVDAVGQIEAKNPDFCPTPHVSARADEKTHPLPPKSALFKSAQKVTLLKNVTPAALCPVTSAEFSSKNCGRFEPSRWVLRVASVALAGVGLSMNATYAHSLGNSDISGWLFLALGVAADASALVLPSVAASAWKANDRLAAISAWAAFAVVFTFAIIGAVGFASTSISDVTTSRASRVTPVTAAAERALADAQGARDRECKSGTGKFCREREAQVASARQNLEQAMAGVAQGADPQAAALVRIVTWVSHGVVAPSEAGVGMLRLILLSLLPQLGGILIMVARR